MGKGSKATKAERSDAEKLKILRKRFLRRLLLAVGVVLLVWLVLKAPYGAAVSWVAQGLTRIVSFSPAPVLEAQGNNVVIGRRDFRPDSGWLQIPLVQVHANIVPYFALGWALASSRKARWRVVKAFAWLAAAHVLTLVAEAQWFYASQLGPWSLENYSPLSRALWGVLRFFLSLAALYGLPILLVFWALPEETALLLGLRPLAEKSLN